MSEAGKVSLPMTHERITKVRKLLSDMNQSGQLFPITVGDLNSLLAALEETQHLLQDHGPQGRNYTNEQYVTLQTTLEDERARGDKWEKAFDNADRQYLKQEKAAADLRRELTKFQTLASDNHTLAARFERELAEAQQTIARQGAALGWYELGKPELAQAALGNKEGEVQP